MTEAERLKHYQFTLISKDLGFNVFLHVQMSVAYGVHHAFDPREEHKL